jgi:cytochrome c
MRRGSTRMSTVGLIGALALVGTGFAGVPAAPAAAAPVPATVAPAVPAVPRTGGSVGSDGIHGSADRRSYQVLVFTGGQDATTRAGVAAIRLAGLTHRFTVVSTSDSRVFIAARLARFRTVVFLNTSGAVLSADQQAAYQAYFTDGGGFVGIHSAIATAPAWQFLSNVLGTRATGSSAVTPATVKVADRVHPAGAGLPEYWKRADAYYNFAADVRGVSHVLATVDETTYSGGTMGADHPIMWCKDYRGGRSFYTGLGGTAAAFGDAAFRRNLAGAIDWSAGKGDGDCGATVLANYQMSVVAAPPNIGEPIEVEVLPDGRVLQTTRPGQVRLHDPVSGTTTVIATIAVYNHDEDGLYGGAIDPDFARNHWVYLYYAPPLNTPADDPSTPAVNEGNSPTSSTDPHAWDAFTGYNQLSRFRYVETPTPHLDPASEQQILRVGTDRGACCHVAGEIRFDSHGNLLMVTGDDTPAGGGNSGGFSPFNDELTVAPTASCPAPCYNAPYVDARRSAGNTNDLRGKLLRVRVRPDGTYTIPKGNLFRPGTALTRPEIYAMGFRNPFRLNLDANDVAYVTDYSPDSRTPQVFRGPPGVGRLEIVRHPANYGWPYCVSPTLPYYRWNFTTSTPLDSPPRVFECANPSHGPSNESRHNTGLAVTPALTAPDMWYSYNDNNPPTPLGTPCAAYYTQDPPGTCPRLFPELGPGGGVGPHGAAPYHFDPKNPNPTKFPAYYDGSIFFGEFTRDYLREIRLDSRGRIFKINNLLDCGDASADRAVLPFVCDAPMDMRWGPDGDFYLLSYGDGFFRANPDALLVKFSYVKGQRAPTAVVAATPTSGVAPLTVSFSSAGSSDPDPGDSIGFAWDFDGNGTVDSTDPNPSFTYTAGGVYTARLTVTDPSGKTGVASTTIEVGNTAPTVRLTTPADGGIFDWGDRVPWSVTVTDPEDGTIDCSRVTVSFALGHDNHGHGEGSQTGCSGIIQTDPEDATHASGYLYGGITASYTDLGANGQPPLTTIDQRTIQQRRQQPEFALDQSGTSTAPTTDPDGGDANRTSLDPGDWVAINRVVNLSNVDSVTFRVAGGAGAVEIHLDSPTGPLAATIPIAATAGTSSYASQTTPVTDPGGTHRLYLVFRSVTGGPTTNLLALNWLEFNGRGVTTP